MRLPAVRRLIAATACLLAACLLAPLSLPAAESFGAAPAIQTPLAKNRLLLGLAAQGGRVLAVGEQGHILWSDDAGGTWTHAAVPVSRMLTAVAFSDAGHAWATGHDGLLLASDDRGETWRVAIDGIDIAEMQAAAAREEVARLEAVIDAMADDAPGLEDTSYALDDAIFDLEDAEALLETGITSPLLGLCFVSAEHGYAFGAYGVLLETRDGGDSWQLVSRRLDNPDKKHLYAMTPVTDDALLVVGEAGTAHRSEDGGATWMATDIGYAGSLFGALSIAGDEVVAFGLRGRLFRSSDAGSSWREVDGDERATLVGGTRLPDGRVALVGAAGTLLVGQPGDGELVAVDTPRSGALSAVLATAPDTLLVVGFGGVSAVTLGGEDRT